MISTIRQLVCAVFLLLVLTPTASTEISNDVAFRLMLEMRSAYEDIHDYTATFVKRERRKGKLRQAEVINFVFKRPFKVRMKWLSGKKKGQEAVYVEGENDNLLIVKMKGLIGRLIRLAKIDPEGALAMKSSRRSIKRAGIGNLIESLIDMTATAHQAGDLKLRIKGDDVVEGREVVVIERTLPSEKYDSPKTLIYIDKASSLPVKISRYDADERIMEEYSYLGVKTNRDLSDTVFDLNKHPLKQSIKERDGMADKAQRLLGDAVKRYESIKGYEATFIRQEVLESGLGPIESYEVKFLKPHFVYMKQIEGPHEDLELYYSPDRDKERLLVVPDGKTGAFLRALRIKAVPLDIRNSRLMKESRHAINEFGLGAFLEPYEKDLNRGVEAGDLYITVTSWAEHGESGQRVELILKNKSKLPEYYAARSIVFFSDNSKLPTDIRLFNESGEMIEWYRYQDLEFDTGLEPDDFNPED